MDRRAEIRKYYQSLMVPFDPVVRDEEIIELCLAGWPIKDIATKVDLSTSRVRIIAREDNQNRYKKYLAREKCNAQKRLKRQMDKIEKLKQYRRSQIEKGALEREQAFRARIEKLDLEHKRAIADREQLMDDLCIGVRPLVRRRHADPEFKKRMDKYLEDETHAEFMMRRRANPDYWQPRWS